MDFSASHSRNYEQRRLLKARNNAEFRYKAGNLYIYIYIYEIRINRLILMSQAEAIRKILGQDSNRKKREEKLQKKRDEIAQARGSTKIFSFPLFFFLFFFSFG